MNRKKHVGLVILSALMSQGMAPSNTSLARGMEENKPKSYELDPSIWQRAVITEVMLSPVATDAETGQWIEIQNLSEDPVNLQGMVLSTNQGGLHVISPSMEMILDPGDIKVLGRVADAEVNGGVEIDYVYGDDLMLEPDGYVFLLRENKPVDWVIFDSAILGTSSGRSLSLEPLADEETSLKDWCLGRLPCGSGNLGTPGETNSYCDSDGDGLAEDQGDCNDGDAAIRPGADESCNGIDDDCDGYLDEDVVAPTDLCPSSGVCQRITIECRGASGFACVYPDDWQASETWCDNLDNDCDGLTDEDQLFGMLFLGDPCVAPGVCGPGTVVCSHATKAPTCSTLSDGTDPKDSPEACNGIDDDCDDRIDNGFDIGSPCETGFGECVATGVLVCDGLDSVRCDATPGTPGPELCGDGLDNDCDDQIDEDFDVGATCTVGTGACRVVGTYRCSEDRLEQICRAEAKAPTDEVCSDNIDNDCDGDTDEEGCHLLPSKATGGCSASGKGTADNFWLVLLVTTIFLVTRRLFFRAAISTKN